MFKRLEEGMSISIRTATRDDIPEIVEVYCSGVQEWFHWSQGGRGERASYDELMHWERWMHGGPWMDATSLSRYCEELELCGAIPLVAELEGKVVGHLDLVVSREPFLGPFLWLDVLMVHREHRRTGVATALIGAAENMARKQGIDVMMTYPEEYDGPSGLSYRSVGFEKFQEQYRAEIECDKPELPDKIVVVSTRMNQPPPLDTHEMICGRENISQRKWIAGQLQAHVYHPLKSHDIMLAGLTEAGPYYFRIQQWAPRNRGLLTLWSPLDVGSAHLADMMSAVKTLAIALGMSLLQGLVLEKDLETLLHVGFRDKGKGSPLMRKILRP